ncbi:MAG: hypothetical protein HZB59_08690 [Ignavibacteriales bacterium]|nr:hypothetical protein [Ignavibacteriales bacterium]
MKRIFGLRWTRFWLLGILTIVISNPVVPQISGTVSKVVIGTPQTGMPLSVQVDFFQSSKVEKIEIAFRRFGEQEFKQNEMSLVGTTATILLPGEVIEPPFVEYYFIITIDGRPEPETYPVENPKSQPLKISFESVESIDYKLIVLSPDRDEVLRSDELLISFSLANLDTTVSELPLKIIFDETDLSALIIRYGDLVVLRPQNALIGIQPGRHKVRVEIIDSMGVTQLSYSWEFTLEGPVSPGMKDTFVISPWRYGAFLQLETRQEHISDRTTPYNRATLSANGSYKEFEVRGFLYNTNEERAIRQPQNRYHIIGESPWLKIGYGDVFPVFPDLVMNGKRVRGFFTNLTLNKFNLDFVKGAITRRVEGSIGEPILDSLLNQSQQSDPTAVFRFYDSLNGFARWVKVKPGIFSRDIMAVRPSFGNRYGSHWGISYLKSKDDPTSILFGARPQENVVFGSDLNVSIDRDNFELTGQVAFSATNNDITNGSFNDSDIDSLFADSDEKERDDMRKIRDLVKNIITVNENLIPLNIKHFPTLSYETGLKLNYFNNNFRLTYLRHGDGYESFGQSFLRTDVQGYSLSDRLRLLDNRLFISGGYERLQDNTSFSKPATTTFSTINAGVSYYPASISIPNISIAFLRSTNLNDLPNTDTTAVVGEGTNRFIIQLQKGFSYIIEHNAQLNLSTSVHDDNTPRNFDTKNLSLGLSVVSTFDIPLQTIFNINVNSSKYYSSRGTENNVTYTTLYVNGQYKMLANKLNLSGSFSPTFGSLQRILLATSGQYYFLEYLSAQTSLNFYFNNKITGMPANQTDIIWTFTLRADI